MVGVLMTQVAVTTGQIAITILAIAAVPLALLLLTRLGEIIFPRINRFLNLILWRGN